MASTSLKTMISHLSLENYEYSIIFADHLIRFKIYLLILKIIIILDYWISVGNFDFNLLNEYI